MDFLLGHGEALQNICYLLNYKTVCIILLYETLSKIFNAEKHSLKFRIKSHTYLYSINLIYSANYVLSNFRVNEILSD